MINYKILSITKLLTLDNKNSLIYIYIAFPCNKNVINNKRIYCINKAINCILNSEKNALQSSSQQPTRVGYVPAAIDKPTWSK